MRKFNIWEEGYACTGESGTAQFLGSVYAETFKEACDKFVAKHPEYREYYDPEKLAIWGCRLFDNESDARKCFG